MTNTSTVQDFVAAWNRLDLDAVYAMMADDIVWDNVPMGPVKGHEGVKGLMAGFQPIDECNWEIHHIAENGNSVMTERTDRFLIGRRWRSIRVMGLFLFNSDGRITLWRDYFDMGEFQREFS